MKLFRLINFELKKILNIKKIIVILLIIIGSSFGIIKFSELLYYRDYSNSSTYLSNDELLEKMEFTLNQYKQKYESDPSANNLYRLKYYDSWIANYKYMWSLNLEINDWRNEVYTTISNLNNSKITFEMYLDGVDMTEFNVTEFYVENEDVAKESIEEIEDKIKELQNIIENGYYYNYVELLLENKENELDTIDSDIKLVEKNAVLPNYTAISRLHQLKQVKNETIETIKIYNYIIDNKIEDHHDWRYLICQELPNTLNYKYTVLDTEEEFKYSQSVGNAYLTYQDYYNSQKKLVDDYTSKNKEYWYYLDNNIEPLTFTSQQLITPYSSRIAMNNSFFMVIISLIITIVLCGGIVANEHKYGTIRLLLTKPYKRYKVLLSKLLVTIFIFLGVYLTSIIVTYLLGGIMYGFINYNIPLVFNNNGVITSSSYLLFTFKNILYEILVSLLFLMILFSLSSLTLLSTPSIVMVMILVFVSLILPYIVSFSKVFTYIPLILLNFYEVIYGDAFTNININYSLWVSLIYMLLIIVIAFVVYCKSDVKN